MELKSNELETEQRQKTLIIRFTRPDIRNPLSVGVLEQLERIIKDVSANRRVATVVFTGSETSFASGADLREIALVTPENASEFARKGQRLMQRIADLPLDTIAAVNGFCFGGALDLALACDLRIASRTARFAHPGTGLGIITGWGGTQRLPRLIGRTNALELLFTAEAIGSEDALRIGLVDLVADDIFKNDLLQV